MLAPTTLASASRFVNIGEGAKSEPTLMPSKTFLELIQKLNAEQAGIKNFYLKTPEFPSANDECSRRNI